MGALRQEGWQGCHESGMYLLQGVTGRAGVVDCNLMIFNVIFDVAKWRQARCADVFPKKRVLLSTGAASVSLGEVIRLNRIYANLIFRGKKK